MGKGWDAEISGHEKSIEKDFPLRQEEFPTSYFSLRLGFRIQFDKHPVLFDMILSIEQTSA